MSKYLTWSLFILFLVGCNTTKDSSATIPKTDPLLGSGPPVKPASYTPPPPNTQPITLQQPTTQAPTAPSNSMSTAELAAGIHQPLDANHDLRIGNPNATNNPVQGDGWRPQGGAGGPTIALNRPEPIPDSEARPSSDAGSNAVLTSGSTAAPANGDPLLRDLKARGMVWIKMELNAETGDWDLACAFPNRQNPDVQRTYEVRARDQATGLRAILDRVDRDR